MDVSDQRGDREGVARSPQAEPVVPATRPIRLCLRGRRRTNPASEHASDRPLRTSARVRGRSPTKFPS